MFVTRCDGHYVVIKNSENSSEQTIKTGSARDLIRQYIVNINTHLLTFHHLFLITIVVLSGILSRLKASYTFCCVLHFPYCSPLWMFQKYVTFIFHLETPSSAVKIYIDFYAPIGSRECANYLTYACSSLFLQCRPRIPIFHKIRH